MHKDLDNFEGSTAEFEVCIVGSGPAGLAIATKLIEEDIKFVILESGDIHPHIQYQELNKGYSKGQRKLNLVNSRLRCFGGGGKLWAGVSRPMDVSDFEKGHLHYSGWPINYTILEKYYKEAANIFGLDYEAFFNEDWRKQTSLAVKFDRFAQSGGILRGVSYQRASIKNRDLTNRYQEIFFASKNCTVITNATVVDLVPMKKNFVKHVLAKSLSGKKIHVNAKNFVLCAGAIENARILLDSSLDQDVKNNKYLGSCFMSHPAFRGSATLIKNEDIDGCEYVNDNLKGDFGFELNSKERKKSQILRHNIHLSPSTDVDVNEQENSKSSLIMNNLRVLMNYSKKIRCKFFGGRINSKYWNLDIAIEQEPRMANYVKLANTRDLHGKRQIEVFWDSVSDIEMKTVFEAVKAVGRESVLTEVGVCKVSDSLINKEIFKQDDAINHHIGTTRMAESPKFGVVDSNLKCFNLSNLYISGSSVFPTSSIVNPTFSIVALSLRLGEHIKNQLNL